MRPLEVLFIDKGGVLVAPDGLGPQWRRLLGEFLSPVLDRDDDERQLNRARAAGFQTVPLARDGRTISRHPIARTLTEVPQLLRF